MAYDIGTGGLTWVSRVDGGPGDALSPRAITVTPDGNPVVATYTNCSANPLDGQSADVHDAIIVAY